MSGKKITFRGEVFVEHPVPSTLKQIMNESGYRIIDAIHAPEGQKTYTAEELLTGTFNGDEPGETVDTSLKGFAERNAQKREDIKLTYFGDTQLNLLRDTIKAGKLLRVNKVTVAGEEVFGYEDDQGTVLDGYFQDEGEAHQILEDTVAEYGSDDTLALYGMMPDNSEQRAPNTGDPGVGTGTESTPAGGAPLGGAGTGNGGSGSNDTEIPADWETSLAWNEKVALAKKLSGKDKIEASGDKTVTAVAEDIIREHAAK